MTVGNSSEQTVECRESVLISTSQNEVQIGDFWMNCVELDSCWLIISVLNECNSSGILDTVGIVNVCPNSFNISILDVLDHVR